MKKETNNGTCGSYLLALLLINFFGVIMTTLAGSLDAGKLMFNGLTAFRNCAILSAGITIFAIACWWSNKNHREVETTSLI